MRRLRIGLIVVALAAAQLAAQQSETIGAFELRPIVGMFIPTGGMRNDFRDGSLVGMQGGFEFTNNVHMLLGGFWSPNTTHFSTLQSRHADIWQFDAGMEANLLRPMGRAWYFRPFVGGGLGIRSYDYQSIGGYKACAAAYGSAGTEFQRAMAGIRLEARDYVTCFESPVTGGKTTRNDIGLSLGFVYHMM